MFDLPTDDYQSIDGSPLILLASDNFDHLLWWADKAAESLQPQPQYLANANGARSHVALDWDQYRQLWANVPDPESLFWLEMQRKGVRATGMLWPDGGMSVWRGSEVGEAVPSLQLDYRKLRDELAQRGVIGTSDGGKRVFLRTEGFENPSVAARVVTGDSVNGNDLWKGRDGRTLAERGQGTHR